ncbi:MAG TPA: hypothetical protein VF412_19305 [Bdellovibrio sp.]|uniref:hypothetical protein n=1 Tax=Bdellovibrio sp. TaxID=28201 RepID=UPI002F1C9C9C
MDQPNNPEEGCGCKKEKKTQNKMEDLSENQTSICRSDSQKTESTGSSNESKRGFCLVVTLMLSLKITLLKILRLKLKPMVEKVKSKGHEMITAMEKGIEAAKVQAPPVGVYKGVDLRVLPKFICFKAALLKEKMTLQYVLAIHLAAFAATFACSRYEIHGLEKQLREKEYILAPGVIDFTPASPQTVSDSYVTDAAMSFISMLGNINSVNAVEQYKRLANFMSPDLGVQFAEESAEWLEAVKNENISETLTVTDREIISSGDGFYKVTALAQRQRYSNGENLGRADEVIEMTLKLVPPVQGKQWYLEITSLKRSKSDGFKAQDPLKEKDKKKHQ